MSFDKVFETDPNELARMKRAEFPDIIRQSVASAEGEHVMIGLTLEIALQMADDIEFAVQAKPSLGYGRVVGLKDDADGAGH